MSWLQEAGLRGNFESLQIALINRFCIFQKQNRELQYASSYWGKPDHKHWIIRL
jgi:hypothetical protein